MREKSPHWILVIVALMLIAAPFLASGDGGGGPVGRVLAFAERNFSVWFSIMAVFAFMLGALSLLGTHIEKVARRRRDWQYSIVTLVAFLFVLIVGLFKIGGAPGLTGDFAAPDTLFTSVFGALFSPLQASQFALLAFFVASAAYRAFRVRSIEAAVLLFSALIILLGRTPFGSMLSGWLPPQLGFLRIDYLSLWIMKVPNTAGHRAIMIGVALGAAAMVVRMLLGIEKGPLSRGRSK